MLIRGIVASWIAGAAALGAAAWLAFYLLEGDAARAALGSGAHALAFLSFFLLIVAAIVLGFLHRFRRVRGALLAGRDVLARWHVDAAEWQRFRAATEPETETGRRSTALAIAAFAVIVTAGIALVVQKDFGILAAIAAGIACIGLAGWALGRRIERAQLAYRDGEVIVGRGALLCNGVLHVWQIIGSQLCSATLDERDPARLNLAYRYWTRFGPRLVEIAAPVPAGALPAARQACRDLMRIARPS